MPDPAFQFFQSPHDTAPPLRIPALGLELTVRLPASASGNTLEIIETSNDPASARRSTAIHESHPGARSHHRPPVLGRCDPRPFRVT